MTTTTPNVRRQLGTALKKVARDRARQAAEITDRIMEEKAPMIVFRPYQKPIFTDRSTGLLILHWSRQIGKSFTLAAWAVDRLLTQLQENDTWLVTVLSNSRDNGAEFVLKCAEVCRKMGLAAVDVERERMQTIGDANVYIEEDLSPDLRYENMRMEVRIKIGDRIGRIKVLAANPRTARGFSGDLILDEFAFHEDSRAIWEAAEPILSANAEFLCRIASTGNGRHNMFYEMVSSGEYKVARVSRTDAWKQGVKIYDPNTRQSIQPEEARRKALDKRAYDQNYELRFSDENMALLTHELITGAERELCPIDRQFWSVASVNRMAAAKNPLEAGFDVGRRRDLSVLVVFERVGSLRQVIGILRMEGMRLPAQRLEAEKLCRLPMFRAVEIDMTGIGLGLFEELEEIYGSQKIRGVDFGTTEPISDRIRAEGRKHATARVTEIMALDLVGCFEDCSIQIPADLELREDLRKPERIVTPGGRVSIAATRDEAGHADHFWALALGVRAGISRGGYFCRLV